MASQPEHNDIEKLAEILSKQENIEAVTNLINSLPTIQYTISKLEELKRTGSLDVIFNLLCLTAQLRNLLTDEMIAGGAEALSTALELLSKVKSPAIEKIFSTLTDHPSELEETIKNAQPVKGVLGLMKALRDPDVQQGLGVIIAFLKYFGKYAKEELSEK
ncbi:MAG: DUF1641 domain-containing protein [Thermoprotei archaeon]